MADGSIHLPPIGEAAKVAVELLDFDENNPRFTPDKKPTGSGDSAVIAALASSADLAELIQSISTSGYINIEPLIVIERAGRLAVLEGNRRLAAVKVLRDPELAKAARMTVPPMAADKAATLHELLVFRVVQEDDARDLIGFKHINGPQSWDAFAKARFAVRWLDDEHRKHAAGQPSMDLNQIASRMGDQHSTMHRMVAALYVLNQAEANDVYRVADRKRRSFSFSHLYTGLAYEEFTNYLGMAKTDRSADPSLEPVPEDRFGELRNLLTWLYGSKDRDLEPAVKSQNPDLGRLREVLSSPAAVIHPGNAVVVEQGGELKPVHKVVDAQVEIGRVDRVRHWNRWHLLSQYHRAILERSRLPLRAWQGLQLSETGVPVDGANQVDDVRAWLNGYHAYAQAA